LLEYQNSNFFEGMRGIINSITAINGFSIQQ